MQDEVGIRRQVTCNIKCQLYSFCPSINVDTSTYIVLISTSVPSIVWYGFHTLHLSLSHPYYKCGLKLISFSIQSNNKENLRNLNIFWTYNSPVTETVSLPHSHTKPNIVKTILEIPWHKIAINADCLKFKENNYTAHTTDSPSKQQTIFP